MTLDTIDTGGFALYGPDWRLKQILDAIYTAFGYPRFVEKYTLYPSLLLFLGVIFLAYMFVKLALNVKRAINENGDESAAPDHTPSQQNGQEPSTQANTRAHDGAIPMDSPSPSDQRSHQPDLGGSESMVIEIPGQPDDQRRIDLQEIVADAESNIMRVDKHRARDDIGLSDRFKNLRKRLRQPLENTELTAPVHAVRQRIISGENDEGGVDNGSDDTEDVSEGQKANGEERTTSDETQSDVDAADEDSDASTGVVKRLVDRGNQLKASIMRRSGEIEETDSDGDANSTTVDDNSDDGGKAEEKEESDGEDTKDDGSKDGTTESDKQHEDYSPSTLGKLKSKLTGKSEIEPDENEEALYSEAARRVAERDGPVTDERIKAEFQRLKEETSSSSQSTGVLPDSAEREEQAALSVGPEKVDRSPDDHFIRHGSDGSARRVKIFSIIDYPTNARPGWLDKLFGPGLEVNGVDERVSIHINPRDNDTMLAALTRQQAELEANVNQDTQKANLDFIEDSQKKQEAERIRSELIDGVTKLYDIGLYIELVAEDEESLSDAEDRLRSMFRKKHARVVPLHGDQMNGMRAMAPDGQDSGFLPTTRLDLASIGTIFPFIEPSIIEPGGVTLGFSKSTNDPVIYDRYSHSGYNVIISGKIGSGKTFISLVMNYRRLLHSPDTELTVIDPTGGFSDFVEALNGQTVSIDYTTKINPMEIPKLEHGGHGEDEKNAFQLKIQSVMGLLKNVFDDGLSKGEEGILRRALKLAYFEAGICENPETHDRQAPILQDAMQILSKFENKQNPREFIDIPDHMPEKVSETVEEFSSDSESVRERRAERASNVLLGMEQFRKGGQYGNLNGQTNVDISDQIVQFNLEQISTVSSTDKTIYMHLIMDWLYQRAKANPERENLLTIDECHELLDNAYTSRVLNSFTRKSRHYNTGLTLISQTIDEWLSEGFEDTNYSPIDIYKQCDARILLYHESLDPDEVEELGLNKKEVEEINTAVQGDKDGTDYSEALVCTDERNVRTRVFSYGYELHMLDDDLNIWAYRVATGMDAIDTVPPEERETVQRILAQDDPPELNLPDSADIRRPTNSSNPSAAD